MSCRGLSMIELIIGVAIMAIILGLVIAGFSGYRNQAVLNQGTMAVLGLVRDARARTLVAKGNVAYGVHFDINQAVLFSGSVYQAGQAGNVAVSLPRGIGLATTSLGVNELLFTKLSGEPNVSGSLRLYRLVNPAAATTITINPAGIVSTP